MTKMVEPNAYMLMSLTHLIHALNKKREQMERGEQQLIDYHVSLMIHLIADIHSRVNRVEFVQAGFVGDRATKDQDISGEECGRLLQDLDHIIMLIRNWPFANDMIAPQLEQRLSQLYDHYTSLRSTERLGEGESYVNVHSHAPQSFANQDQWSDREQIELRLPKIMNVDHQEDEEDDVPELRQSNQRDHTSPLLKSNSVVSKVGSWTYFKKID